MESYNEVKLPGGHNQKARTGSRYQKRYYEEVGKLIQRTNGCSTRYTAEQFADLFASDDPLFDRERFLKACGLGES